MRSIALATLLVLLACNDGGKSRDAVCVYNGTTYAVGDEFPAGDGCNSCMCTASGAVCTALACADGGVGVDANPMSCAPFGGCSAGPVCGALCCGAGERCENGACRCGSQAACGSGDSCERGGPAGGDSCGTFCCGASGPCPL